MRGFKELGDRNMEPQREGTLWPTKENYSRFKAVCDDEVSGTFEEFEALAQSRLAHIEQTYSIKIEKISFDPDEMARWCRANCGKVDADARKMYAAFRLLAA